MRTGKRLFDLIFSVPGLILLSPFFLVIGLLIKLEDSGPIFFLQERVGQRGKLFKIRKFRTMYVRTQLGMEITVGQDPRVTRIGRSLRRWKLDELPQLINVIRGEMSLVGPRPEVPKYVALYSQAQRAVLDLVPGITDAASIQYRSESELLAGASDPERLYVEEIMPAKIGLNLGYAERANLVTDFVTIMQTIMGYTPGLRSE